MEEGLETFYSVSHNKDLFEFNTFIGEDVEIKINNNEKYKSSYVENEFNQYNELTENYLDLNRHRGFLLNESWDKILKFQARILSINANSVICECIIDKESLKFENRQFAKILFEHLDVISINSYILITIKEKKGSTRIDILDGNRLVDKSLFSTKEMLDQMTDLNDPLYSQIVL